MGKGAKELFTNIGFILKIIELALNIAVATMGNINKYHNFGMEPYVHVAYGGYLIICLTFVIVYIVDETHHWFELLLTGMGAILHIAAGVLVVLCYVDNKNMGASDYTLSAGACLLACAVAFIIDFVREIMGK